MSSSTEEPSLVGAGFQLALSSSRSCFCSSTRGGVLATHLPAAPPRAGKHGFYHFLGRGPGAGCLAGRPQRCGLVSSDFMSLPHPICHHTMTCRLESTSLSGFLGSPYTDCGWKIDVCSQGLRLVNEYSLKEGSSQEIIFAAPLPAAPSWAPRYRLISEPHHPA